jgi:hypothetical protein
MYTDGAAFPPQPAALLPSTQLKSIQVYKLLRKAPVKAENVTQNGIIDSDRINQNKQTD